MKKILILLLLAMPFLVSAQTNATTVTNSKTTTVAKKKTTTKKKVKKSTSSTTQAAKVTPAAPAKLDIPVMTFEGKTFDFGKIKTGDKPAHIFNFTNTGSQPLDINVVSACECTELEYTEKTVKPGEKGYIKATFNTLKAEPEDHKKPLKKDITIVLKQTHPKSGYPLVEELKFDVFIID
jgi:Protein of unknown function (DUF1573)